MVSCDGHSSTSRNSWPHTFVFTILSAGMVCRTASLGSGAVKHQGFPGPRTSATHADGQPASTSLAQRTSSSMRAPAPR